MFAGPLFYCSARETPVAEKRVGRHMMIRQSAINGPAQPEFSKNLIRTRFQAGPSVPTHCKVQGHLQNAVTPEVPAPGFPAANLLSLNHLGLDPILGSPVALT